MTSTRFGHWLLLLGGICSGCKPTARAPESDEGPDTTVSVTPRPDQAPPLPPACRREPKRAEDLKACADTLHFDSLEVAGDEQRLMVNPPCPGKCRYGPLATIQPERDAHLYSEEDLKEGRVIARMFLSKGEKNGYKKLGLVPGQITYWWVQKVPGRKDGSDGRSVYFTATRAGLVKKEFPLKYESYGGAAKQALARWLWDSKDEKTQGTCSSGTCK